jgi:transcriptional regulator with XRE-family HTH domain
LEKYWTKNGCRIFGRLLKRSRESSGLTLRDVENLTATVHSGVYRIDRNTLNILEGGRRVPNHNQVSVLAEIKLVKSLSGRVFTSEELFDVLAESLDPDTGWYTVPPGVSPKLADLIQIELKNRSQWLGLEQLAEVTGLTKARLLEFLEDTPPSHDEIRNLASGLKKNFQDYWTQEELQQISNKKNSQGE